MARVNIETRAFAENRFDRLREDLKLQRYEAAGLLTCFWFDSQEREVCGGTQADISKYLPMRGKRAEEVFAALLEHDYISTSSDGKYVIRGNKKHVDAILKRKFGAKIGGINSGKSRRKKSKVSTETEVNSVRLQQKEALTSKIEPNSIQFNSIQLNSIHPNSVHSNSKQNKEKKKTAATVSEPPLLPPDPSGDPVPENSLALTGEATVNFVWKTWEAYRDKFFERYGFNPPEGASKGHLGKLKSFVKQMPPEAAPHVAAFYISHNDNFYVRAQHSLGPMIAQAAALYTQWKTGKAMLGSEARQIEKTVHNSNTWNEAFEYLRNGGMKRGAAI